MLNRAMCLPPTFTFFRCPAGTSWISATFTNPATTDLLNRTRSLFVQQSLAFSADTRRSPIASFRANWNSADESADQAWGSPTAVGESELKFGCRFVTQFLQPALRLKKYSGCNLRAHDGSVNRRCPAQQANRLRLLLDPTASA